MNWTFEDLKKKGLIHNYPSQEPAPAKDRTEIDTSKPFLAQRKGYKSPLPQQIPRGLAFIIATLSKMDITFIPEYKFLKDRKFKFDIAIPSMMVAIEYEGLMSEKSGHTTLMGYTSNCNKYNLAAIHGWKMLRYTTVNYKNIINDIEQLK